MCYLADFKKISLFAQHGRVRISITPRYDIASDMHAHVRAQILRDSVHVLLLIALIAFYWFSYPPA